MKIKYFCKFIEKQNTQCMTLRDTEVVIDGQNFFYQLHQNSDSQGLFGCESDGYATYLRERLSIFTKANVKCYFIFKGGHNDFDQWLDKKDRNHYEDHQKVLPLFMKDVYKQVLDELGFHYSVCEVEAKEECIAFAQKYSCPLISFDIMYCFSRVRYIPYNTINFNEQTNSIDCRFFTLDHFLNKYGITEDKLATFAAISDQLNFPSDHNFQKFFKTLKFGPRNYEALLQWLAKNNKHKIWQQIMKQINKEDWEKFKIAKQSALKLIRRNIVTGLPTDYIKNGNIEILEKDPLWFAKGVALKHISIPLINLGRKGTLVTPRMTPGVNVERTMLLSMDIIKYTYNLLTNFQNQEIQIFLSSNDVTSISVTDSVSKPEYTANSSPFENGWTNLPPGLFQHFLNKNLNGFNMRQLDILREDLKLLMLALVYFTVHKQQDTTAEVFSVLLSYVTLSIICKTTNENNNDFKPNDSKETTLTPYFDEKITKTDKEAALTQLRKRRGEENEILLDEISDSEAAIILDVELLEPLMEFQHCIQWLNYLNIVCGRVLKPVVYHKVYNASFVYRLVRAIRLKAEMIQDNHEAMNGSNKEMNGNDGADDDDDRAASNDLDAAEQFLEDILSPAPTVLAYLRALFQIHQNLVSHAKNGTK